MTKSDNSSNNQKNNSNDQNSKNPLIGKIIDNSTDSKPKPLPWKPIETKSKG